MYSHLHAASLALMGVAVAMLPACTNNASTPAAPSTAATYRLAGVISDDSTRRGIAGARVEVVGGINAGKFAVTNSGGEYVIESLGADSFRVRASAAGYDAGEQGVAVPANARADFLLKPGCAYTVSPTTQDVAARGGSYTVAITRTAGTCGWQASVSNSLWIGFPGSGTVPSTQGTSGSVSSTSGSGTATLNYLTSPNPDGTTRTGSVTIAWDGGSATVALSQAVDFNCGYTASVPPTQQNDVLPSGEKKFFTISRLNGTCGWQATSNVDWITFVGAASGGYMDVPRGISYQVGANPSGTPRSGTMTVSWPTGSTRVSITQLGACTYSISPDGTVDVPSRGGQLTVKMTRTLGACTWDAGAFNFVSISARSGGDGDTFTVTVAPNATSTSRFECVSIRLGFNTVDQRGGGTFLRAFFYTGITVRQAAPGQPGSSEVCRFEPPLTE